MPAAIKLVPDAELGTFLDPGVEIPTFFFKPIAELLLQAFVELLPKLFDEFLQLLYIESVLKLLIELMLFEFFELLIGSFFKIKFFLLVNCDETFGAIC